MAAVFVDGIGREDFALIRAADSSHPPGSLKSFQPRSARQCLKAVTPKWQQLTPAPLDSSDVSAALCGGRYVPLCLIVRIDTDPGWAARFWCQKQSLRCAGRLTDHGRGNCANSFTSAADKFSVKRPRQIVAGPGVRRRDKGSPRTRDEKAPVSSFAAKFIRATAVDAAENGALAASRKHEMLHQRWFDVVPASKTLSQHHPSIGSTSRVCCQGCRLLGDPGWGLWLSLQPSMFPVRFGW